MSPRRDSEQDLNRLLDADRGDFAKVYDRLSRAEPPARLDRIVLGEAARAIRSNRAPRAQRWLMGFGTAAGIVLAAGIAWQVGKQVDRQDTTVEGAAAPREVISVSPISLPAEPSKESADTSALREEAPAAAAAPMKQDVAAKKARAATRPVASPPMAAPAPPPPPPASVSKMEAAPIESGAAAPQPAAAEPFPAARTSAAESADARDALGRLEMQAEPERAREQQAVAPAGASAPSASMRLHRNMRLEPDAWLGEIIRLEEQGHHQEAIENLRLFRRKYPDWKIPEGLQHLDP